MSYLRRPPLSLVSISEINPALDTYIIKVLVVKLWKFMKAGRGSKIEMILTDSLGSRLHATIEEDVVDKFHDKIDEGKAYFFSNFPLAPYISGYRVSHLSFEMIFYRTTCVVPCYEFPNSVPSKYLAQFRDIMDDKLNRDIMIDVMGQVVNVHEIAEKTSKYLDGTFVKLTVVLRDLADDRLTCVLMGDCAMRVIEYISQNIGITPVCVVRLACIRDWNGEIVVFGVDSLTQVIIDPLSTEVNEFKSMLPKNDLSMVQGKPVDLLSYPMNCYEEFFVHTVRRSLNSILASPETGYFVTLATVESIETCPRWYYIACKVCSRKVHPFGNTCGDDDTPMFDCSGCGKTVVDVIARYRLVMRVSHMDMDNCTFIAFDRVVECFLRCSADNLAEEVAHEHTSKLPEALRGMVSNEYLFKINVSSQNIRDKKAPYRVEMICDDAYLINKFSIMDMTEDDTSAYTIYDDDGSTLFSRTSSVPESEFEMKERGISLTPSSKRTRRVLFKD